MTVNKQRVKEIVDSLYSNGKTPLEHLGIDGVRIIEVEIRHPEVAKQIPINRRVI